MKKFILMIAIISVTAILYSAPRPDYLFKVATEAPDGSVWHNALKDINKELYIKSGKKLAMQIYTSGVMGDQSTVLQKIKIRQLNGATFSNTGLQLIYHDMGVVGFPLMMRTEAEYDHFKKELAPFFEKKLEENGFKILAWSETGPIYVFSKRKVQSVGDLKKSKPFILEGDVISKELYKEVNVSPVPLQTSDILTSLQTGQIDTIFSPPYGLIAMQWFSKVNYMADFPITFMLGSFGVDKQMFDSMPKELQDLMVKTFDEKFKIYNKKIREDNANSLETIKRYGIRFLEVDKKDKDKFLEVGQNVNQRLIDKFDYSKEVYNMVNKVMKNK